MGNIQNNNPWNKGLSFADAVKGKTAPTPSPVVTTPSTPSPSKPTAKTAPPSTSTSVPGSQSDLGTITELINTSSPKDMQKTAQKVPLPESLALSVPVLSTSTENFPATLNTSPSPTGSEHPVVTVGKLNGLVKDGKLSAEDLMAMVPSGSADLFSPSRTIKAGSKYSFTSKDGRDVEIKFHSPDAHAKRLHPGSQSGQMWTAQIKINGRLFNADTGKLQRTPNDDTHIPVLFAPKSV
ncbi:MAG: hypothetical protein ACO1RX_14650 [Candidatus Sericytochromatia bacterium]